MRLLVRNLHKMLTRSPARKQRPKLAIGNLEDRTVPAFFDFSTGMQGWTTGNEPETSFGETSIASSWAPDTFGNGADSLGNVNAGGELNGAENSWVQSPMLRVNGTLTLSFDSFSNNEGGFPTDYDVEHVEYSLNGGGVWTPFFAVAQPDLHTAADANWRTISYTVTTGFSDIALVRFRIDTGDDFGSGDNGVDPAGWFIDNVDIKGATFIDEDNHLVVSGTDGGDTIVLDHGVGPNAGSETLRVFINGKFYGSYTNGVDFDNTVHILAGGSTDSITLIGTSGPDDFQVEDDIIPTVFSDKEFELNNLFITTLEAESYLLKGQDGNDSFEMEGLGFDSGPATQNVVFEGGNGADTLVADSDLASADGDLGGDGIGQLNVEGPGRGNFEGASVLKFSGFEAFFVDNSEDYDYHFSIGGSLSGIAGAPGIISGDGEDFAFFDLLTSGATFTIDASNVLTSPGGKIAGIERIIGTAGLDRLVGATQPTDWTIDGTDGPDNGVYQSGVQDPIDFIGIESLTGGGANDSFSFINDGALSGSIDGGAGTDTISYADFTGVINTSITPAKTTNVTGTWAKIEAFIGSTDLGNTFTGGTSTNTWDLTDAGDGTLNAISFTDYNILVGGASADKFLMGPDALFTSVAGMNGTDTLNYANFGAAVTVNLDTNTTGTANGLTALVGFTGIDSLVGSGGSDTLIATDNADAFVVSTPNAGKLNNVVSFSSFENLDGDLGDDKYTIQTVALNPLESINDAGGIDTLTGPSKVNTWTVTGVDTGDLNGLPFTSLENLTGGGSSDTFDYSGGGETTGTLSGGSGKDTVNFGTGAVVDLLTNTAGSSAGIVANFVSIESFVADGGTLNGPNINSTWKLTGSDMGTLNSGTQFSGFSTINAGTGADRLMLYHGTLTGAFNAGAGTDILDYSGVVGLPRPYKPLFPWASVIDGMGGMIATTGFNKLAGNL